MRLILLGCARSGTSMIASLFSSSGAFDGQQLLKPSISNPKGYYEDSAINQINNKIIEQMLTWPILNYRVRLKLAPGPHRDHRAYAVASPPVSRKLKLTNALVDQIEEKTRKENYCYKDPRFSNTLNYWRPYLPEDVKFLVAFREPNKFVESYMRNAHEAYSPPLPVDEKWLFRSWRRAYRRIISNFSQQGKWMFVHYDQVIQGDRLDSISDFCGVELNSEHIDLGLSRSKNANPAANYPMLQKCMPMYRELCTLANYSPSN